MTNSLLLIAGQTDVGRHRNDNQDTFISKPLWSASDALLVVIDGVGGYAGGAQAAALAKESIEYYMTAPTGDTLTMLREAVVYANNQIVKQKQDEPALARMCCVLTAAVANVATHTLQFVHVGDTRLYRFRRGELTKLTRDHSLVGVREDANQLTEREAMKHPRRNEILRDVGSINHRVDDPEFLESGETDFLPGDGLLLCSDGLTDMLTRAELTNVFTQSIPAEEQATELIRQANEQGGQDNITVVLAWYPVDSMVNVSAPVLLPAQKPMPAPLPEPIDATAIAATLVGATSVAATSVGDHPPKTGPSKWIFALMGFIVVLLVASISWWQPERRTANTLTPPLPANEQRSIPILVDSSRAVSPDSLTDLTIKSKPDSIRRP